MLGLGGAGSDPAAAGGGTQTLTHPPPSPGRRRVKHPNILQLVDVYITRKEYFIFLEL